MNPLGIRYFDGIPTTADFAARKWVPLIIDSSTGKLYCLVNGDVSEAGGGVLQAHDHDAQYSALGHTHDYAEPDHNHDGTYATAGHNHDADYAAADHTHPGGSEAFPVGSIFISVVSTDPATLLGYGTWAAFGSGRVLVGLDATQTEFDTVKETGGAKTVTLTAAQSGLPQHTHVQNAHTHVQDAHSHVITSQTATTGGATSYEHGTLDTSSAEAEATETTATATAVNQNATAVNQDAGPANASQAHTNLQPYIVAYFWERTA